uniref:Uncharacterized protein n=1 Tax=Aegilops tauschii subsp. strangulata TaxID=200361 RepID=A0A453GWC0_AEGTS
MLRAMCRSMEVRGAARRPRRTCMVAASMTHSGMATWRCCAAVEAAAVQGNKPWRRAGRDRCVLWVRTGRVGRVGCARDVRDAMVWSGSSGASGARGTCGAQRDARRVSPAKKELGVCRRGRDGAWCAGPALRGGRGAAALGPRVRRAPD